MSQRRLQKKDDNDTAVNLNINISNNQVRENLPRRCKVIQPFYNIDFMLGDDSNRSSTTKKRRSKSTHKTTTSLMSSSTMLKKNEDKHKDKEEATTIVSTILAWLIEMKVLKIHQMVYCMNGTNEKVIGHGIVTINGIICCCCKELFTVSSFPFHGGDHLSIRPYERIYVEGTNVSLLTCQIEAWNRHSVPARDGYHHIVRRPRVRDHHDDSCVICADGGDLICCEKCPSTYHPKCMGFEGVPQEEWHCPYCHCKYCDHDASCTLLLTCFQCLKKYHWQCSEINDRIPFFLQPPNIPFCGNSCWQLYQKLEAMVGRSLAIGPGLSWTLVRRMDLNVGTGQNSQDLHLRANCNSLIALASKLMEDSFKLIVDRHSRTNMIQSVVYSCGSNFTRTNFSRFYTAVLEFQGQIITTASIRMPSPKLAEIPFIATNESWRNQGMCRLLLIGIESALAEMGIERIVIPSAEDMERSWKEKFRFISLDEAVKREITALNTLMFPKTTRLQKVISVPRRMMIVNDLNLPPEEEN